MILIMDTYIIIYIYYTIYTIYIVIYTFIPKYVLPKFTTSAIDKLTFRGKHGLMFECLNVNALWASRLSTP